jgi:hypothetical protein
MPVRECEMDEVALGQAAATPMRNVAHACEAFDALSIVTAGRKRATLRKTAARAKFPEAMTNPIGVNVR